MASAHSTFSKNVGRAVAANLEQQRKFCVWQEGMENQKRHCRGNINSTIINIREELYNIRSKTPAVTSEIQLLQSLEWGVRPGTGSVLPERLSRKSSQISLHVSSRKGSLSTVGRRAIFSSLAKEKPTVSSQLILNNGILPEMPILVPTPDPTFEVKDKAAMIITSGAPSKSREPSHSRPAKSSYKYSCVSRNPLLKLDPSNAKRIEQVEGIKMALVDLYLKRKKDIEEQEKQEPDCMYVKTIDQQEDMDDVFVTGTGRLTEWSERSKIFSNRYESVDSITNGRLNSNRNERYDSYKFDRQDRTAVHNLASEDDYSQVQRQSFKNNPFSTVKRNNRIVSVSKLKAASPRNSSCIVPVSRYRAAQNGIGGDTTRSILLHKRKKQEKTF